MKVLFGLIFLVSLEAFAIDPLAVEKNKEGIEHLEEENNYLAYQSFVEALGKEPFRPEIKMNLAKTFELNEEFEKAIKSNMSAYKLSDGEEAKFYALFNTAVVQAKNKQVDAALSTYQKALELRPESIEVKTNTSTDFDSMPTIVVNHIVSILLEIVSR